LVRHNHALVLYGFSEKGVNGMAKWLKIKEAAEHLRLGCSTLSKLANEGRIPAHKTGRERRFDSEELDNCMKSGKPATPGR